MKASLRGWAFLQASMLQICPQPPSDSLSPLSPYQPPRALVPYGYLRPIFGISLAYIDHIFAIYIGPVTFSEHFQHSPTTSWPQCTCTTIHKQYCEVKSICAFTPRFCTTIPPPPLHRCNGLTLICASYFHPFIVIPPYIVILIYLPALKHFKHTENICNE